MDWIGDKLRPQHASTCTREFTGSRRYVSEAECRKAARFLQTMPYGKHKGKPFPQIPDDYLDWLCRTVKGAVRDTAAAEFERRTGKKWRGS